MTKARHQTLANELRELAFAFDTKGYEGRMFDSGICYALNSLHEDTGVYEKRNDAYADVTRLLNQAEGETAFWSGRGYLKTKGWEERVNMVLLLAEWIEDGKYRD